MPTIQNRLPNTFISLISISKTVIFRASVFNKCTGMILKDK